MNTPKVSNYRLKILAKRKTVAAKWMRVLGHTLFPETGNQLRVSAVVTNMCASSLIFVGL